MSVFSPAPVSPFYCPDLDRLKQLAAEASPASAARAEAILSSALPSGPSLEDLASLAAALLSSSGPEVAEILTRRAATLREELFGNTVIPMAPVEVSNACASDCLFCGWRVSNRAMKRLRMSAELAMLQVEYLVDQGIHYIEFVSGDDITVVRDLFPDLIRQTRALFDRRGIEGKIAFCTLALTEIQYRELREAGADAMVVWQETYDPGIFQNHVVGGPKAFGITDDWKVDRGGDGCRFRIESQERAMRAGLEVALGSMLGLNPDLVTEFLATVEHARVLSERYGSSSEHPIIIGMPIWNAITTRETDLRPDGVIDMGSLFVPLAALYLLALPGPGTWVFPNCRVPLRQQVEATRVAGVFSSTEVKLGPGGYLPAVIQQRLQRGEDVEELRTRLAAVLREEVGADPRALQKLLDEREQFVHHYHSHSAYRDAMAGAGLEVVPAVRVTEAAASGKEER